MGREKKTNTQKGTSNRQLGESKKEKEQKVRVQKSGDKFKAKELIKDRKIMNEKRDVKYKNDKSIKNDKTTSMRKKSIDSSGLDKQSKKSKTLCPVMKKCGGCQLLDQSYEQQLKDKQKLVENLLNKFCKVDKIIGMNDPYHYRNKVHAVFDHDKKGNPISGIYEPGTHRVIPVESCLIENEKADEIIGSIRGLLKSFKIKTYDEDTGYGLLRHVLVRVGYTSGEYMVVLVLGSPIMPSKNNFVKALRKLHPEITTIVVNVNDKKTSMILGEKEQVIYGKGYIEDTLCGKVFRISPKSFYQVNPVQTEILYNKAIEYAKLSGSETIIDAYCGIGTIGIIASEHVKKVIGVELNKDAVRDAVINAKRNNITKIDFYNKDAGEFMRQMAEQNQSVDVVFMDPPRAGSDETFLNSLCSLSPKKVVYISCNPVTLERDLVFLTKKGYKVEKAVPVDMFPGTEHVETVVLLSHKKPDDFISIKMDYSEDRETKPDRVTYKLIQEYIEAKYGFKVHMAYIAEVKRSLGLPMYDAPNAVEKLKYPYKPAPPHKVEAIKDALKHFKVIE